MSISLKAKILRDALQHIPEQSFTLRPLLLSVSSLPNNHADYDPTSSANSVVDVLFGSELNARRELVQAWEQEGLKCMLGPSSSSTSIHGSKPGSNSKSGGEMQMLADIFARRLEYSSRIGEHLVEAQALLSAPSSSPSLPIPRRTLSFISSILPSMPPLYRPPNSTNHLSSPSPLPSASESFSDATTSTGNLFSSILSTSNDRIPLLQMNPLGPLSYAWRIADRACYHLEKERGLKKGTNGEPVGAGPEWYIGRIGLGLVYLVSESHLLAPKSEVAEVGSADMRLQKALMTLDRNLGRYQSTMGTIEGGERRAGDMVGYLGFIGRAWAGIIRSRGW